MWASRDPGRKCWLRSCVALAAGGVLYGCAVGPNFERPSSPAVTHYTYGEDATRTAFAHGTAQRFSPGAEVAADWWRIFRSQKLDVMIGTALARNPGLEAAQASLRQSEDSLRSGYGIFYPQIAADASASRQRFAPESLGESAAPFVFNLFTLSASVHYAFDIFGGERRMIEALGAQVDLQRATVRATYLTLVSNIVNTVIARAAYRSEVEATRELIGLESEQVALAEVQARAGTVPYSNVLSLKSQLAATEATVPQLEQKLAQSDDLLATLVGYAPAEWQTPDISLTDLALPGDLPVSLPSDLVRQRPDILVAEATAHSASANIGVATAALLPSVTLSGGYSANGLTSGTMFAPHGREWSLGAGIGQPLFEGGTLWFKRKAAIDSYHQAAALYRQTVLGAFEQVADTLRALDHDAAALRAQDEALEAAAQALHLIQVNYQAGLATYLDVLNADGQYHLSIINELQAVALRYQDTVALYVALGGGWWNVAPVAAPTGGPPPAG